MTYDQWELQFKPEFNHILGENNAPMDGYMYETFGEELDYVKTKADHCWTIIDGEGSDLVLIPGMHWVDRLGYIICKHKLSDFGYEEEITEIIID